MAEDKPRPIYISRPNQSSPPGRTSSLLAPALIQDFHVQYPLGDGNGLSLNDPWWNICVEYEKGEDFVEPNQSQPLDRALGPLSTTIHIQQNESADEVLHAPNSQQNLEGVNSNSEPATAQETELTPQTHSNTSNTSNTQNLTAQREDLRCRSIDGRPDTVHQEQRYPEFANAVTMRFQNEPKNYTLPNRIPAANVRSFGSKPMDPFFANLEAGMFDNLLAHPRFRGVEGIPFENMGPDHMAFNPPPYQAPVAPMSRGVYGMPLQNMSLDHMAFNPRSDRTLAAAMSRGFEGLPSQNMGIGRMTSNPPPYRAPVTPISRRGLFKRRNDNRYYQKMAHANSSRLNSVHPISQSSRATIPRRVSFTQNIDNRYSQQNPEIPKSGNLTDEQIIRLGREFLAQSAKTSNPSPSTYDDLPGDVKQWLKYNQAKRNRNEMKYNSLEDDLTDRQEQNEVMKCLAAATKVFSSEKVIPNNVLRIMGIVQCDESLDSAEIIPPEEISDTQFEMPMFNFEEEIDSFDWDTAMNVELEEPRQLLASTATFTTMDMPLPERPISDMFVEQHEQEVKSSDMEGIQMSSEPLMEQPEEREEEFESSAMEGIQIAASGLLMDQPGECDDASENADQEYDQPSVGTPIDRQLKGNTSSLDGEGTSLEPNPFVNENADEITGTSTEQEIQPILIPVENEYIFNDEAPNGDPHSSTNAGPSVLSETSSQHAITVEDSHLIDDVALPQRETLPGNTGLKIGSIQEPFQIITNDEILTGNGIRAANSPIASSKILLDEHGLCDENMELVSSPNDAPKTPSSGDDVGDKSKGLGSSLNDLSRINSDEDDSGDESMDLDSSPLELTKIVMGDTVPTKRTKQMYHNKQKQNGTASQADNKVVHQDTLTSNASRQLKSTYQKHGGSKKTTKDVFAAVEKQKKASVPSNNSSYDWRWGSPDPRRQPMEANLQRKPPAWSNNPGPHGFDNDSRYHNRPVPSFRQHQSFPSGINHNGLMGPVAGVQQPIARRLFQGSGEAGRGDGGLLTGEHEPGHHRQNSFGSSHGNYSYDSPQPNNFSRQGSARSNESSYERDYFNHSPTLVRGNTPNSRNPNNRRPHSTTPHSGHGNGSRHQSGQQPHISPARNTPSIYKSSPNPDEREIATIDYKSVESRKFSYARLQENMPSGRNFQIDGNIDEISTQIILKAPKGSNLRSYVNTWRGNGQFTIIIG